jgi:hypothetical protein
MIMSTPSGADSEGQTTDPEVAKKRGKIQRVEWLVRGGLAGLAIAALVLAALEGHEAIGTALVGAAVAFGLASAFFDRVIEVSTTGVKLADLRALQDAAEREVPSATPDEKEDLIEEGKEILATKRSAGEPITPDLALREASISWLRNGFAVEIHFASWLVEHGWTVKQSERFVGAAQPDLIASRDGRRIAVEVKTGRRPLGISVIRQVLAMAASVEAVEQPSVSDEEVLPVLVLGEIGLTRDAIALASRERVTVYSLEADNRILHRSGPELS